MESVHVHAPGMEDPLGFTSFRAISQIFGEWLQGDITRWSIDEVVNSFLQYPDVMLQRFTSLAQDYLDNHQANQRVLRRLANSGFTVVSAKEAYDELKDLILMYERTRKDSLLNRLQELDLVRMPTIMSSTEKSVPKDQKPIMTSQTLSGMIMSQDGRIHIPFAMNDLVRIGYSQIRAVCSQYVEKLSPKMKDSLGNFWIVMGDVHDGGGIACFA